MIRTAVIGVGAMGRQHARIYKDLPNAELVAVTDTDLATAEKVSRLYGVPAFQDYRAMLDKVKPDAVSVAVPTAQHYEVVTDLLKAGCHILVEKPIAATAEHADKMIAAAKDAQKILMVGHIERFNPAVIDLKRRLQAGQLGRIFQLHARRLGPYPSRIRDVGVILDLVPHDLDIMRYLVNEEVVNIYAESRHELNNKTEDLMIGILRFEHNAIGILEINWMTPTKIRELYVTGERGMFMVNYITQDLYFYENAETEGDKWQTMSLLRGVSEGCMTRYPINKVEPLRSELDAFIRSAQTGEPPAIDSRDARNALDLTLAILDAGRKN
jgi:UDP-N-acetylglucosamine 3-dehydrogenase